MHTDPSNRAATIHRQTLETDINLSLSLDVALPVKINSSIAFLDHMLQQLCRHGKFSLELTATGDTHIDYHHLVEDVGISLGLALRQALKNRTGINRYGSARIVMDEALVEADVDLTTRIYLIYNLDLNRELVGTFDTSLMREFWLAVVNNCGLNLHISQVRGENAHHIIEASFKAVGKALHTAISYDPSILESDSPSTKGLL